MKTIKFSLILLAFMAFAQTTWAQSNSTEVPCLPGHGETEDQSAWCGGVQEISLTAGWNWVSFYVEAEDLLEQLEAGLGENGLTIKSKTQNTAWDEDEEEWVGSLEEFSNDKTYRVQTTAACSVTLTGSANSIPGDYTITINRGWNWIGFPSAVPMSVEVAFSNFEAMAGDQIKSKTQSTAWDEDEEEWSGTLTTLEPGIGFMFYSEHDGVRTLEFPSATSKARGGNSKMSRE